jgi:diguanylate cyclase (GGDEF)-like protein
MRMLDTPIEERFERLTRLAVRLLGTPVAAISLVDADRQYFKSVQGMNLTGSSREHAFCAHTILQSGVMVIPDARIDPRFSDNPFVTGDTQQIFYAGHPIFSRDGSPVGAFCVTDSRPRAWSQDDAQCLQDLARLAEAELLAPSQYDATRAIVESMPHDECRALIDPLTRLWNHEGACLALERALASPDHATSCVLLDVDNLSAVNARHGEPAGDAVLRSVGRRLLASIRETDSVGRYGGDEFLLVLTPCADRDQAEESAQALVSRITDAPIQTPSGSIKVSATAGVSFAALGRGTLTHTMVADAARDLAGKCRPGRCAA